MAKYCIIPAVVEATQWFKNGDHPKDACKPKEWLGVGTGPSLTEGKVVRYYRTDDVHGQESCELCGKIMHQHGWIDIGLEGHTVCPGDWIITDDRISDLYSPSYRYPVKPEVFALRFVTVSSFSQIKESGLEDVRERVANLCHEQWSGWMEYLYSKCVPLRLQHRPEDAVQEEVCIPIEYFDRWKRQMVTPYAGLSPEEQDSDRTEADKFLTVFLDILKSQPTIYQDELKEALADMANQFGFDSHNDSGPYLHTGGLSALEFAFRILDWGDKHYILDQKCQAAGCNRRAICGQPTPGGYMRLCGKHSCEAKE